MQWRRGPCLASMSVDQRGKYSSVHPPVPFLISVVKWIPKEAFLGYTGTQVDVPPQAFGRFSTPSGTALSGNVDRLSEGGQQHRFLFSRFRAQGLSSIHRAWFWECWVAFVSWRNNRMYSFHAEMLLFLYLNFDKIPMAVPLLTKVAANACISRCFTGKGPESINAKNYTNPIVLMM